MLIYGIIIMVFHILNIQYAYKFFLNKKNCEQNSKFDWFMNLGDNP